MTVKSTLVREGAVAPWKGDSGRATIPQKASQGLSYEESTEVKEDDGE